MKIEKLPSGSYRIRATQDKKTYSIVTEYKPTKSEAMELIGARINQKQTYPVSKASFYNLANEYISSKDGVLSPSSVSEYNRKAKYLNREYGAFCALRIGDIASGDVQRLINDYCKGSGSPKSPKTVRDMYSFIELICKAYNPGLILRVNLPKPKKSDPYIPDDDDVSKIAKALEDTKFEVPVILGAFGMRRSEICALDLSDIDGCTVHIRKSKVICKDGGWIIKNYNKTTASTRDIEIPQSLADKIMHQGYIYKGHPGSISKHMHKLQAELGIKQFSLHKLRHYYASSAHLLGVADSYIMVAGGWSTDSCLKRVYRHAFEDKAKEVNSKTVEHLRQILS